jgi:hypothetical protein
MVDGVIGLNDMRVGGWVGAVGAVGAIFAAWLLAQAECLRPHWLSERPN